MEADTHLSGNWRPNWQNTLDGAGPPGCIGYDRIRKYVCCTSMEHTTNRV